MSPHVIDEILDFLDGRLSPERMDEIRRHLETCEECARDVEWARAFRDRAEELDLRHPSAERLVDLADGVGDAPTSSERTHLESCAACREEMEWARSRPVADAPNPMPTTPAVRAAAARRRTPWRWAWAAGVMATAALLLVVLRPGSKHTIPAPPLGTTPSPPVAVTPPSLATLAHLEPLPVRLTRGAAEPGSFEEARVMGLEAYQSGRYDSAAVRFQRALSHRPEDAEMRLYLASTDLMQRRSAAAIPRLQQLANDSSGAIQGEALWLLANAQLLEERAADAITTLERLDAMEGRHRLEAETLLRTVREKSAPK